MTEISNLINIAENIGMNQAAAQLKYIEERSRQTEAPIIMPFVGEFSAGKTTLINALTDSKKLETSTKPTTATIFEIHFGQPKCDAEVFDSNGKSTHIDDIADLKNATLGEVPFVLVNDTSTKISSSTIIVDTPGLSSPEPKHKETLVKFLPKADGIILVVDVNQSITKSLTDFVKTMKMSKRPIFLVVSKCDSKSPAEVDAFKKYIAENCEIEISQVVCVSVKNNDLEQLYSLFKNISTIKASILEKVNAQRVKNIAQSMVERIDDLLKAGNDDKKLNLSIKEQEQDLKRLNNNISTIINDSEADIEEFGRIAIRQFVSDITPKLDAIAKSSNINFDQEAVAAINTTTILVLNEFKQKINHTLREHTNSKRNTNGAINLQSLQNIDMHSFNVENLSYTLCLNDMGHEYDGYIAKGLKVAAVVAAVAYGAPALGGAGLLANGADALEVADTVDTFEDISSEVDCISTSVADIPNAEIMDDADYAKYVAGGGVGYVIKDQVDRQRPQREVVVQSLRPQTDTESKGLVDSFVGWATDKTLGKPQRMKKINEYITMTLVPSFKNEMSRIQAGMISLISSTLRNDAAQIVSEKTSELLKLKEQSEQHLAEFNKRRDELKSFKIQLSNL